MNVYKGGTKVKFKSGGIEGYITGVCIRTNNISYAISYFSNGGASETWHFEFEFEVVREKQKAGFKPDVEIIEDANQTLLIS